MQAEAAGISVPPPPRTAALRVRRAQEDPAWVRFGLTLAAVAIVTLLIVVPIVNVFAEALADGLGAYFRNLVSDADTLHAIFLTLTVVPIALVANLVFGLAAAWTISRFRFPGRTLLTSLIDLPFSVSPVVAGLMFVLIFGLQGYFGPFLRRDGYAVMPYVVAALVVLVAEVGYLLVLPRSVRERRGFFELSPWLVVLGGGAVLFAVLVLGQQALGVWPKNQSLKIIFATPGLVLATSFVTFPFVARELIPVMDAVGPDEELAALSLGANGWQMFWHITVPNVKWGIVYGAVYVVSGHIAGRTDTMPLRIEKLFQEYNLPGSFAVASVLTLVAIFTLVVKSSLERKLPSVTLEQKRAFEP
jgi:sulfate transport system permease protein